MPKFKAKWALQYNHKTGKNEPRTADSAGEVVGFEIDATNSERGALEDVGCKVEKVRDILKAVVDALPAEVQREVVGTICGWDEVP